MCKKYLASVTPLLCRKHLGSGVLNSLFWDVIESVHFGTWLSLVWIKRAYVRHRHVEFWCILLSRPNCTKPTSVLKSCPKTLTFAWLLRFLLNKGSSTHHFSPSNIPRQHAQALISTAPVGVVSSTQQVNIARDWREKRKFFGDCDSKSRFAVESKWRRTNYDKCFQAVGTSNLNISWSNACVTWKNWCWKRLIFHWKPTISEGLRSMCQKPWRILYTRTISKPKS